MLASGVMLAAGVPAHGVIIGTHVDNGDGTHTYSYTVDNSAGAIDVASWSLDFGFAAPDWDQLDTFAGGEVAVPSGDWIAQAGIPLSGLSAQDFLALDPAGDVLIGQMLGGFSFTSRFGPGTVNFHEFAADGAAADGQTTGPVPTTQVPESGGWTLACAAFAGLLAMEGALRRREDKVMARRMLALARGRE